MNKCPKPFPEDDGTANQCIQRGHCGCDETDKIIAKADMADELAEALRAQSRAESLPTYGVTDYSPPKKTYDPSFGGGECSKHGRYYGRCHCCMDDEKRARERSNAEARRLRDAALRDAAELAQDTLVKYDAIKGEKA